MNQPETSLTIARGALASMLRLMGWFCVNALVALGGLIVAAYTLGGFSMTGTMRQLANLSDRYVAADLSRQSQFNGLLCGALVIFFAATCFFRRQSAIRVLYEGD